VLQNVTDGGGGQKIMKSADVVYGRPLTDDTFDLCCGCTDSFDFTV